MKTNLVIGIDPGIHGGVAIIDGMTLVRARKMPTVTISGTKLVDAKALLDFCMEEEPYAFVIEKAIAMPNQSSVSTLTTGRNIGILEGMTQLIGKPTFWVNPQHWKKSFSLGKNKRESLGLASQTFGRHVYEWERLANNGVAEAALMALWMIQKTSRLKLPRAQKEPVQRGPAGQSEIFFEKNLR